MGNAVPRIRHRHEATAPRSGPTTPALSGRRHGGKAARDAVRRSRVAAKDERKPGGGTTVAMTVKVVVTRKEAERLIARLEEHNAKERKARIAEITRRLRSGQADGGGGGSPARSCGGARTPPRLAPIQEV
ncbi:hypothetical protein ACQ4PT_036470 [Festuca glaucescens]